MTMVSSANIRELDKHKNQHLKKRMRERSRKAFQRLRQRQGRRNLGGR